MTLAELYEDYAYYTGKLGDIVRQLNFSGIAIVWIFSKTRDSVLFIPSLLLWALLLFALSLLSDIFQYIYSSILADRYHRYMENNGIMEDEKFKWSKYWNYPALFFLELKVLLSVAGYILLAIYLLRAISIQS